MKLETSKIKGVLRFREEVTLDYRELGPGLIAFVGENGAGKTTTLEAPLAGLLREFPSRSDKEILDYTTAADGFIETTFELEGRGLFRSRLNLDGPHRKAEGILARIEPDGSLVILNDGKVTTFDTAVREILPPKDVLLASVFSAQNRRGSFGDLDRKARRQLFAALLGLEHLQAMSERAKSAAGLVQQAVEKLTAVRDVVARETSATVEHDLDHRAQQLDADVRQVDSRRAGLQRDLAAIERELETWQDAATAYATARATGDRLDAEISTTRSQLGEATASLDRHALDAEEQPAAVRRETAAALAEFDRRIGDRTAHEHECRAAERDHGIAIRDLEERLANNKKLLDDGPTIRAAVAALKTTTEAITQLRAQQDADANRVEALHQYELTLRTAIADCERKAGDLARARSDADLLTNVPCGGTGDYAVCQFLTQAAAAQAKIPTLAEAVAALPVAQEQLRGVAAKLAALATDAKAYRTKLTALDVERIALDASAKRVAQLDHASERIADLAKQKEVANAGLSARLAEAVDRHTTRGNDLAMQRTARAHDGEQQLANLTASLTARHDELVSAVGRLSAQLQTLTSQRDRVGDVLEANAAAHEQVAQQQALLTLRRKEWDETTATVSLLQGRREDVTRRRDELVARRAEMEGIESRLSRYHTDLIEWNILAKALGRDGLQTLEIDEAGPSVSAIANALLEAAFGTRYRFDLITQEPLKSKAKDGATMREVFELRVYDARDGIWKDLTDLSGGERVVVEEILRSAIGVLVNQKNQSPLRTLWRDECSGALDGENAQRYVAMLRKLKDIGGYWQIILITHSPDVWSQCDKVVRMAGGGLSVHEPHEVAA